MLLAFKSFKCPDPVLTKQPSDDYLAFFKEPQLQGREHTGHAALSTLHTVTATADCGQVTGICTQLPSLQSCVSQRSIRRSDWDRVSVK